MKVMAKTMTPSSKEVQKDYNEMCQAVVKRFQVQHMVQRQDDSLQGRYKPFFSNSVQGRQLRNVIVTGISNPQRNVSVEEFCFGTLVFAIARSVDVTVNSPDRATPLQVVAQMIFRLFLDNDKLKEEITSDIKVLVYGTSYMIERHFEKEVADRFFSKEGPAGKNKKGSAPTKKGSAPDKPQNQVRLIKEQLIKAMYGIPLTNKTIGPAIKFILKLTTRQRLSILQKALEMKDNIAHPTTNGARNKLPIQKAAEYDPSASKLKLIAKDLARAYDYMKQSFEPCTGTEYASKSEGFGQHAASRYGGVPLDLFARSKHEGRELQSSLDVADSMEMTVHPVTGKRKQGEDEAFLFEVITCKNAISMDLNNRVMDAINGGEWAFCQSATNAEQLIRTVVSADDCPDNKLPPIIFSNGCQYASVPPTPLDMELLEFANCFLSEFNSYMTSQCQGRKIVSLFVNQTKYMVTKIASGGYGKHGDNGAMHNRAFDEGESDFDFGDPNSKHLPTVHEHVTITLILSNKENDNGQVSWYLNGDGKKALTINTQERFAHIQMSGTQHYAKHEVSRIKRNDLDAEAIRVVVTFRATIVSTWNQDLYKKKVKMASKNATELRKRTLKDHNITKPMEFLSRYKIKRQSDNEPDTLKRRAGQKNDSSESMPVTTMDADGIDETTTTTLDGIIDHLQAAPENSHKEDDQESSKKEKNQEEIDMKIALCEHFKSLKSNESSNKDSLKELLVEEYNKLCPPRPGVVVAINQPFWMTMSSRDAVRQMFEHKVLVSVEYPLVIDNCCPTRKRKINQVTTASTRKRRRITKQDLEKKDCSDGEADGDPNDKDDKSNEHRKSSTVPIPVLYTVKDSSRDRPIRQVFLIPGDQVSLSSVTHDAGLLHTSQRHKFLNEKEGYPLIFIITFRYKNNRHSIDKVMDSLRKYVESNQEGNPYGEHDGVIEVYGSGGMSSISNSTAAPTNAIDLDGEVSISIPYAQSTSGGPNGVLMDFVLRDGVAAVFVNTETYYKGSGQERPNQQPDQEQLLDFIGYYHGAKLTIEEISDQELQNDYLDQETGEVLESKDQRMYARFRLNKAIKVQLVPVFDTEHIDQMRKDNELQESEMNHMLIPLCKKNKTNVVRRQYPGLHVAKENEKLSSLSMTTTRQQILSNYITHGGYGPYLVGDAASGELNLGVQRVRLSVADLCSLCVLNNVAGAQRFLGKSIIDRPVKNKNKVTSTKMAIPLADKRLGSVVRIHPAPMSNRNFDGPCLLLRQVSVDLGICQDTGKGNQRLRCNPSDQQHLDWIADTLMRAIVLRCTGRLAPFFVYKREWERVTGKTLISCVPGCSELDAFQCFTKYYNEGKLAIFSGSQHIGYIPKPLRVGGMMDPMMDFFIRISGRLQEYIQDALNHGQECTDKNKHWVYCLDGLTNLVSDLADSFPQKCVNLAQSVLCDSHSVLEDPFGVVTDAENYHGGFGSKYGYKLIATSMVMESEKQDAKKSSCRAAPPDTADTKDAEQQKAERVELPTWSQVLQAIVKHVQKVMSDEELRCVALYRDKNDGIVREILTGQVFGIPQAEHWLCKGYFVIKHTMSQYIGAAKPRAHQPHLHPYIVGDEMIFGQYKTAEECMQGSCNAFNHLTREKPFAIPDAMLYVHQKETADCQQKTAKARGQDTVGSHHATLQATENDKLIKPMNSVTKQTEDNERNDKIENNMAVVTQDDNVPERYDKTENNNIDDDDESKQDDTVHNKIVVTAV